MGLLDGILGGLVGGLNLVIVVTWLITSFIATRQDDGAVKLVRVEDDALIMAREPDGQPVSALGWDDAGQTLAFGTEAGAAGILAL